MKICFSSKLVMDYFEFASEYDLPRTPQICSVLLGIKFTIEPRTCKPLWLFDQVVIRVFYAKLSHNLGFGVLLGVVQRTQPCG